MVEALEGLYGLRLDGVDLADGDGGDVEVLAPSGRAGQTAEHGELAGVSERVGDGALHEALDGRVDGIGRREVRVECGESGEEALLLLGPGEGLRIVPGGVALSHGEAPMEEVAHVGEDLDGAAASIVEVGEGGGGVFQGARGAVSQCGKGVSKKIPFFIHGGTISHRIAGSTHERWRPNTWRMGAARARQMVAIFDKLNILTSIAGN